ncbi:MAG: putative virulence factor [Oscillospiraceae bacterium]|jgi:hypothetical protein|nr:putative virulence factor [Oscillospiraceae bacterium]
MSEKKSAFAWADEGFEDLLSLVDGLAERIDVAEEEKATQKAAKKAAKAGVLVAAGAPLVDTPAYTQAPADSADAVEEFIPAPDVKVKQSRKAKAPKQNTGEFFAEAYAAVDAWQENSFGLSEDTAPIDLLGSLADTLSPEVDE